MTIRKRHIARTKSKPHANDYVENLILDKMDSFLFNIFSYLCSRKESAIDCNKNFIV